MFFSSPTQDDLYNYAEKYNSGKSHYSQDRIDTLSTVGRVDFHLQPAIYFNNGNKKQPSWSSVKRASALCTRHTEEEAIASAFPGNMSPSTG